MKRKPKRPRDLSLMLWCRATPELAAKVDAVAEIEDRSRSQMIRALLLRALAKNEKTA